MYNQYIKEKYCKDCSSWKHRDEFVTRHASKDGLSPRCRSCQQIRKSEWDHTQRLHKHEALLREQGQITFDFGGAA